MMRSVQPDTEEARSPSDAPQVQLHSQLHSQLQIHMPGLMGAARQDERGTRMHSVALSCAQRASATGSLSGRGCDGHGKDPAAACSSQHPERAGNSLAHASSVQEWEAPMPSRRPDIFPEFEKIDRVVLPKPLPGDPEMPDEELEEAAKRTTPGDPDPEQKPGACLLHLHAACRANNAHAHSLRRRMTHLAPGGDACSDSEKVNPGGG